MGINSVLKNEGIEIISKLDISQVNKIANIVSKEICVAFPEHNLDEQAISTSLSALDMYIAKMPSDSSVAKYFYKNNSIYLNNKMDLNNIDTLAIHECIHAIQEVKSPRGKLLKLGLFDLNTNKGQGINEAAVQFMSSKITNLAIDNVKYYNMSFSTISPLFYPIETTLINQMIYFTGSYPLIHSTLYSNDVFKNTFIAKSDHKTYNLIEKNFDLLIHYEELLSIYSNELSDYSENVNLKKIKKNNSKIEAIKSTIQSLTISTQNLIIKSCFDNEFETIQDAQSLNDFRQRLYNYKNFIIESPSYSFYNSYYREMMNKLEEKSELIKQYGVLTYLNDLQTSLLDLEKDTFGINFFRKLFDKLKLLLEEALRDKT